MLTEFMRQTRWAHAPEAVDDAECPTGAPYVTQLVWMPCHQCDLQVHASADRVRTEGLRCPECGELLAAPRAEPEDAPGRSVKP
jgi:hypothetical protein